MEFVRDLVSNAGSQHVVQAVVHLARSFGKRTVAEGVEDAAVLELLARYGVDCAQGFHLGRPALIRERLIAGAGTVGGGVTNPEPPRSPFVSRA